MEEIVKKERKSQEEERPRQLQLYKLYDII